MKREFLIERQGKTFVLFAGLLDAAHSQGLAGIDTNLVQVPNAGNDNLAIVQATVTLAGEGGELRTFSGIGEAAPNNVAPPMRTALIRMAETRAKARALRDAINVGVTAFEELAPDEEDEQPRPRRQAPIPVQGEVVSLAESLGRKILDRARKSGEGMSKEPASDKVVQHVAGVLFEALGDEADIDLLIRAVFGNGLKGLSAEQAAFLDKWAANEHFKKQVNAALTVAKGEQTPEAVAQ